MLSPPPGRRLRKYNNGIHSRQKRLIGYFIHYWGKRKEEEISQRHGGRGTHGV
jgi:hypothetical protein